MSAELYGWVPGGAWQHANALLALKTPRVRTLPTPCCSLWLRDAALRQLAGELPDWPSESLSRLAEASLQLLAVSGVPEPCACIRMGSRGRWALFVQQPCALMARVAQQWQLCWAVADAFSAASQQHNQQGAGPHAQPSCPPAERCFDLPALLAALPALPAQAQQGCWQAASSEDAGFCLAGLHQLVPVAKEAAAKGRPALLSTVAGELKAALAEWQHECMGAGSRSSLAELLLVPAGSSCSREAAAVAAALVQAGCTLPRYALAGEGTAEAGQGAHAGEHCAMPAECTEVGQSQHAQVQATSWQTLPPSAQQALVRYQLHLEALRAWAWCAWLLGVAL